MNSPKNLSRVHEDSSSDSSFSELCLRELSSDSSKKCSDSDCSLCVAEANKTKSRNRFSEMLLNNATIKEDTSNMVKANEIGNKGPKRQGKTDPTTITKKRKPVMKNFKCEGESKESDAVVREVRSFKDEIHADVFENSDKSFSPQRSNANTSTPKAGFSGARKNRRAD